MMRNSQVYIQGVTKHRLRLLANVTNLSPNADTDVTKRATADSIADSIINEWMTLHFPEIKTLENQIEELENATAVAIKERSKK